MTRSGIQSPLGSMVAARPWCCIGPVGLLAAGLLGVLACAGDGAPGPPVVLATWGESGREPGQLFRPTGIAIAADGTVFVANTGNDRIEVFDENGVFLRTFGGSGEGPGEFRRPMDVDLGADGLVYVAELGGDRVQVFRPRGELVRTIRGDGTPAGAFDGAAGVLVSPEGDIYVADFYNGRVVEFGKDGTYRGVIGRGGRVLPGRLHYPTDLAWLDRRLVVADAYNHRIQVFTPAGEVVARWGGPFGLGLRGSRPGWFRVATGVATDGSGRVYVADFQNHRIQVFDETGNLLAVFGSRGVEPGKFERPTDLDIGPDGRIYVVDFGNDRVQVFASLGGRAR